MELVLVYISQREDVIRFHSLLNVYLVDITQRREKHSYLSCIK